VSIGRRRSSLWGGSARRRLRFAAAIVTAWVAASRLHVAVYIADARAPDLPRSVETTRCMTDGSC